MTPRLTTAMRVSALIRRAEQAGGSAMLIARGEPVGGGLLILCQERGQPTARLESVFDGDDYRLVATGGSDDPSDYVSKRRRVDPDLWVVELDIPAPERFAVEILNAG